MLLRNIESFRDVFILEIVCAKGKLLTRTTKVDFVVVTTEEDLDEDVFADAVNFTEEIVALNVFEAKAESEITVGRVLKVSLFDFNCTVVDAKA